MQKAIPWVFITTAILVGSLIGHLLDVRDRDFCAKHPKYRTWSICESFSIPNK